MKHDEEELLKIIKKVQDYELFLQDAYEEINKYTNLERVDWLIFMIRMKFGD